MSARNASKIANQRRRDGDLGPFGTGEGDRGRGVSTPAILASRTCCGTINLWLSGAFPGGDGLTVGLTAGAGDKGEGKVCSASAVEATTPGCSSSRPSVRSSRPLCLLAATARQNASANPVALAKRCSGFFSNALRITRSTCGGTCGSILRGEGGRLFMCIATRTS